MAFVGSEFCQIMAGLEAQQKGESPQSEEFYESCASDRETSRWVAKFPAVPSILAMSNPLRGSPEVSNIWQRGLMRLEDDAEELNLQKRFAELRREQGIGIDKLRYTDL